LVKSTPPPLGLWED